MAVLSQSVSIASLSKRSCIANTLLPAELITEYASITSAPHMIPVIDQGWETHMDGMTINGQFMDGHSGLISYATQFRGGLPPGKTIAVVDSGSSFS